MPQLDISTFPSQIFWLIICFGILCLVMATLVTPKIATSLSKRHQKLSQDNEAAERLLEEAQLLHQQTAAHLNHERQHAIKQIQDVLKSVQNYKMEKLREFDHQLAQNCKSLEKDLSHQSASLLANADDLVIQVTSAILEKLTPVSINENHLKVALQKLGAKNA